MFCRGIVGCINDKNKRYGKGKLCGLYLYVVQGKRIKEIS